MSKGLEALNRIYETSYGNSSDYEIIEKELKALEIIKKYAPYGALINCETEEEYKILREVLNDEN